ncbi:P-loop NTPase fold protein [Nocardia sp. NPDC050175]|uniref:P-loop NTPase fold protein n=1 Tax=Nocardia sp. NPDC050175 TaxID=3364317 RepID=UPI0037B7C122
MERLLRRGDLIEDREVVDIGSDRLSHAQIARQLGELVGTIPAPSNVALYGPWGSGKSGIGNLLREVVDGRSGTRFARFDAFKYAETPLRRNFISAVATELQIYDNEFHDGLYSGHTRTDIKVPASKIIQILMIFAILMLGLSSVIVGVVALVALLQSGPYGTNFSNLAKSTVTAGLVPAALLSALITFANKTMQVDRNFGMPDSDEQFEKIFKKLVGKSGAKRLVIFVDELDRCGAEEVVATLDAIRTFLGVEKCVFVIAADQQVLEESLTREAKQETPADDINPYYSTGSAYLDKVFQYQVSLPPLMSQRITRFAADLVKGRDGLWSELKSDYVVSVLVPTHVTSPRRVKHLLNTFALTYRMAEDRHRHGLLAEDPHENAAAVAKLVCLRVEFPLFARDLEIDARLPEMVLSVVADPEVAFDGSWPAQAVERATAYGAENAPPASMIRDVEAGDADGSLDRTVKQSNRQLLDYIRRTKPVRGPSRDLVFMHSSGAAFGLDGQTALAIEAAAENADIDTVADQLKGADQRTREGVVDLLNHLIRTGLGVGGPNAARTLLRLYDIDDTLPVSRIADSASEMIAVHIGGDAEILDQDTIEAAWNLAGNGSEAGSLELRSAILAQADQSDVDFDASFVLRNPAPALGFNDDLFARLIAREIVREGGEESVVLLRELADDTALHLVHAAASAISDRIRSVLDAREEFFEAQDAAAAPNVPAGNVTGAQEASPMEEPFDPLEVIDGLVAFARDRAIASAEIAHSVMLLLLRVDRQVGRNAVEELVCDVAPSRDVELVDALLTTAQRRAVAGWSKWFAGIAQGGIAASQAANVGQLGRLLWVGVRDNEDLAAVESAVAVFLSVSGQLPPDLRPNLTAYVADYVEEPVTDDVTAEARSRMYRNMEPFFAADFMNAEIISRQALSTIAATFETSIASPVSSDSPLIHYLLHDVVEIVRLGTLGNDDAPEQLKEALSGIKVCDWLLEPLNTELLLLLMATSGLSAEDLENVPSVVEISALVEDYGLTAERAVLLWISEAKPDRAAATTLFAALRDKRAVTDALAVAVGAIRSEWSKDDRLAFLRAHVEGQDSGVPTEAEAHFLGLGDADDRDVGNILIERSAQCSNNGQRRAVVGLWAQAGVIESATQKRLIEAIVLPFLKPSTGEPQVGMTEIALAALDQVEGPIPRGVKGALGEAVKAAVAGNDALEKKAVNVLGRLGYQIEKSGFFGRKKSVRYTDEST